MNLVKPCIAGSEKKKSLYSLVTLRRLNSTQVILDLQKINSLREIF